ncbi:isochorismate synthase MenF [Heyndrickxia acidicola]|uniref:isochorismate synthase n=1 Tax=Heyndrickxia acidicola TaxID=209389 RepID=A0ABU6MMY5_9BACI|nr:isochorismate synthase [Heyndrickxia acidicola]MED1206059.1 isochorismate synthase [Heyndrickxia acidicola]
MPIIHHSTIQQQFNKALEKASLDKRAVLFSYTEELSSFAAPLDLFSASYSEFYGERYFWKEPNDEVILIGLGSIYSLRVNQQTENRFQYIDREWEKLLASAYIFNPFDISGTGPLLMGGFSFDSETERDQNWTSFGNAAFHLPQIMISSIKGQTFLTINIMATRNDDEGTLELLQEKVQKLFGSTDQNKEISNIVNQEELNAHEWKESVALAVNAIQEGELDKVVLSRRMRLDFDKTILPEQVLSRLWMEQHQSYLFALEELNHCFTGASPERLILKENDQILSTCLAGSIKRTGNAADDGLLGLELLNDRKNRDEHQFVVKMISDVLDPFCIEMSIPDTPEVMKMRDIQHLYTPVRGKVNNTGTTLLKLVEALHPTPALGGIPREKAMELIREVENSDRGFYGAPVGWFDYRGNGEFCVAIRSGLLKENEAILYSGCGIVADSNPEDEYIETGIKFKPMLRALGGKNL